MSVFASFSMGQPPARHTKVVDNNLCPLKSDPTRMSVPVCAMTTSSKPTTLGRAVADVHAHTTYNCVVCDCGSVRCKTCDPLWEKGAFVPKKIYRVFYIAR
jgi:hypothetical protein